MGGNELDIESVRFYHDFSIILWSDGTTTRVNGSRYYSEFRKLIEDDKNVEIEKRIADNLESLTMADIYADNNGRLTVYYGAPVSLVIDDYPDAEAATIRVSIDAIDLKAASYEEANVAVSPTIFFFRNDMSTPISFKWKDITLPKEVLREMLSKCANHL